MKEENRVEDKILEIEKYLEELIPNLPTELEEYKKDFKIKAVCERYFEKIVEAMVDLAFIIIKDKKLKIPEDDKQAFDILSSNKIISQELSERLKDAKGMRNVIIHEYGRIEDDKIFHSVTEELEKDTREFINNITNLIKMEKKSKKSKNAKL